MIKFVLLVSPICKVLHKYLLYSLCWKRVAVSESVTKQYLSV